MQISHTSQFGPPWINHDQGNPPSMGLDDARAEDRMRFGGIGSNNEN
jgi:hypothetical protein